MDLPFIHLSILSSSQKDIREVNLGLIEKVGGIHAEKQSISKKFFLKELGLTNDSAGIWN